MTRESAFNHNYTQTVKNCERINDLFPFVMNFALCYLNGLVESWNYFYFFGIGKHFFTFRSQLDFDLKFVFDNCFKAKATP